MAGDATQRQAVIDARCYGEPIADFDGGEGDVIGVFEHRDASAAVEGDVELARQAIELTMMQNEMMQGAGMRACIDQFLRIDAGRWAAGDVADIIRT
jgi:hypothetical protein